jgi:hypothetical protein
MAHAPLAEIGIAVRGAVEPPVRSNTAGIRRGSTCETGMACGPSAIEDPTRSTIARTISSTTASAIPGRPLRSQAARVLNTASRTSR